MRQLLIALSVLAALGLTGCGNSSDAAKASGNSRLFDDQRDALEKAKQVGNTLNAADQAHRAEEENQTK